MVKRQLFSTSIHLSDGNLYRVTVHDLEPSGIVIRAYDSVTSIEYSLPINEHDLRSANVTRKEADLRQLTSTLTLVNHQNGIALHTTDSRFSNPKHRLTDSALEEMIKQPIDGPNGSLESLNELIVKGLVELSREKPVGRDAVRWLGEWFLSNNPLKPSVVDPDDEFDLPEPPTAGAVVEI